MQPDILNPILRVNVKGVDVEVRELSWKDHVRAIKELTSTVIELLKEGKGSEFNAETIIEAITKQETLAAWVIAKSTGNDSAWVDSLSAREALAILCAVVELNLTEEVIGRGKALAERMSGVFGLSKVSLERSTA